MCDCDEVQKYSDDKALDIDENLFYITERQTFIFTPFQYQIQQLIRQYGSCEFKLLQDFYNWCIVQRKERIEMVKGRSMEELWLMFYMWREHYKLWDGEKWVNEKRL